MEKSKFKELYLSSVSRIQELKKKLNVSNTRNAELELKLSRLTKDDKVRDRLYKYECIKQYYLSLDSVWDDNDLGMTPDEFYSMYHIWKNHRNAVAHPPVLPEDMTAEHIKYIIRQ